MWDAESNSERFVLDIPSWLAMGARFVGAGHACIAYDDRGALHMLELRSGETLAVSRVPAAPTASAIASATARCTPLRVTAEANVAWSLRSTRVAAGNLVIDLTHHAKTETCCGKPDEGDSAAWGNDDTFACARKGGGVDVHDFVTGGSVTLDGATLEGPGP